MVNLFRKKPKKPKAGDSTSPMGESGIMGTSSASSKSAASGKSAIMGVSGNSLWSAKSKDTHVSTGSGKSRNVANKKLVGPPIADEQTMQNTFEDWLKDSRESFQLKKYNESGCAKLSLEGQLGSPTDAAIIPHLIKNDTTLTWLSIGDSKMGQDGCMEVIEALKHNKMLKFIGLSYNEIDLDGCLGIKEMLTVNQTLTSIDLKNNNIKDLGFVALMDALQDNHTITDIDLRRNHIPAEACHAMKDALEKNTVLQRVELKGNSIGNEGCRMIIEGLQNNTTVHKITLEGNKITEKVLDECNVFLKRNAVIHIHRESISSLGISFYVTMTSDKQNSQKHLAWAEAGSTTVVGEAAKTVESGALTVFIEELRTIVDCNNTTAQPKLSDTFNPVLVKLMRDKRALRKLLNLKINDTTYLTHTIAASKHPSSTDMLKFLVDKCSASFYTAVDDCGLTARAIALASEITAMHEYANTHGTFLGRYVIEGGKGLSSNPVHRSTTSAVHFATDVSKTETDPQYEVALKIMSCGVSFERERRVRLNEGESLSTFTSGQDLPINSKRFATEAMVGLYRFHDEMDIKGKHYQCLVFEKNEKNLHQILGSELISGHDESKITYLGLNIARAIEHMHYMGYVHADIKPRNVLRGQHNVIKLIDLDNSIAIGEKLTEQCSSAFISPEMGRAMFGCKPEETRSIQKHIIEQQEVIAKLDMTKTDDIDAYTIANDKIQALLGQGNLKGTEALHASPALDIWAFGVIMYYMCIGKPLFLYDNYSNLAIESEKRRLLCWKGLSRTDLDKVCPVMFSESFQENIKTFLMKCLHVDPAERFQSMEEIIDHAIFVSVFNESQVPGNAPGNMSSISKSIRM